MFDITIWVAQLLEGSFAAAVHWLNADITVQGLVSQWNPAVLAALCAYLPPAECIMLLLHAGLCAKRTITCSKHATSC